MKFWKNHWAELLLATFGITAVNALFIVNHFRGFSENEAKYIEPFGSFIGGYVGSLISLGAMLLLVLTLKAQRYSNEEQSFEAKYLELLKIHRDNVTELSLWTGLTGRRLFLFLLGEVRDALRHIESAMASSGQRIDRKQCLQAAYYVMFYGVGPNSTRMLVNALTGLGVECALAESIAMRIEQIQKASQAHITPFDGHQSRLGHYYRHLYQMIRFIDQQTIPSLDDEKKYEYVKTVRAQLSTHEQALLLLNSLTPMGYNWWDKDLISKYRLVQNIPEGFFDPVKEFDEAEIFPSGYFEWQEAAKHVGHDKTPQLTAKS
jgi:hypothetical protein